MKNVIAIFILIFFIYSCQNNKENKSNKENKAKTDSIEKAKTDSIEKNAIEDSIALAKQNELDEIRFKELVKNFDYKKDEFSGKGWYRHKIHNLNNILHKNCLFVHVNSTGYYYLEDQYYDTDWIFHTKIEVKIGNTVYRSKEIPTYNEDNVTENYGGYVWENISYTSGGDKGIVKAIAENDTVKIKVRFIGRQYNSDFTLSEKDKKAIKESYELSCLIYRIKKARKK